MDGRMDGLKNGEASYDVMTDGEFIWVAYLPGLAFHHTLHTYLGRYHL